METVSQVKELIVAVAVLVGLISTVATLIGTFFMMKFQLGRHDEQICELKIKDAAHDQQLQNLQAAKVDGAKFDSVLFNGQGALVPQMAHIGTRLTRVETICRERHASKDGHHTPESRK